MNQHYPPRPAGAIAPPPPPANPPRVLPERDYAEWVERNADRLWHLLRQTNQRDLTFNQLARQLWSSV